MAAAMGISKQAVGQIVAGKTKSATAANNARAAAYFGCDPDWLATGRGAPGWSETPIPQTGVAQSLSHARPIIPLKRLEWGELMTGELPETFELEVQDDAMAPFLPRGCFARFSTAKPPRAAWPVLVADADGHAYIRDYVQGRGAHFVAEARAPGYQPLDSERDKLRVLAVLTGVDWG